MNDLINNFNQKELSGRDARLLQEWRELDYLCSKRKASSHNPRKPSLSYIIRKKNIMGLPTEYEIWYRCKSIIGVKDTGIPREPIFGNLHKVRITVFKAILWTMKYNRIIERTHVETVHSKINLFIVINIQNVV